MKKAVTIFATSLLLTIGIQPIHAETNYIINEIKIGLHQSATTDSPILLLLPGGAAVNVLERNNELVKVTEAGGKTGWINARYLTGTMPDRNHVLELEQQNQRLQGELRTPQRSAEQLSVNDSSAYEIEQRLNRERLKVGELQAQLAEIKANIPAMGDNGQMEQEIEQLKQANATLVNQMQSAGIEINTGQLDGLPSLSMKSTLFIIGLLFIVGMLTGAFVLDYLNRRRHGGFRI